VNVSCRMIFRNWMDSSRWTKDLGGRSILVFLITVLTGKYEVTVASISKIPVYSDSKSIGNHGILSGNMVNPDIVAPINLCNTKVDAFGWLTPIIGDNCREYDVDNRGSGYG